MKIRFLGATGTVTGSRYLVSGSDGQILIDCGLFQGLKALRLKNRDPFPVAIADIDAIFLTHAHIDHSGYLPRLYAEGYRGPIYCSAATADLCRILLPDAAKLLEEEAYIANKHGYSKHHPALPLYTSDDAHDVLRLLRPVELEQTVQAVGLKLEFRRAGHILGATMIRVQAPDVSVIFSGDLGRSNDELILAPAPLPDSDYVVIESTYGNRRHIDQHPRVEMLSAIQSIIKDKSTLLIPAFAVGRAQEIIYHIARLKSDHRIPEIPVYLDSPMATSVTDLYHRYPKEHRLSADTFRLISNGVRYVQSVDESKQLDAESGPRIIISASGMATGGRVLHHIKALAANPRNIILFAGYQAAGTRGATLVSGIKEIKIHGQYIRVEAQVLKLDSLSAHADSEELLAWLKTAPRLPQKVFVTHGEPEAADSLRRMIQDRVGCQAMVPELGQEVELKAQ